MFIDVNLKPVPVLAACVAGAAALLGCVLPTATSAATAARATFRCDGEVATIVGTVRSDELQGTPGRDVVVSLGGDDFIRTGGGNDLVCSGTGFDFVRLGPGSDRALGGAGDDTLAGGLGTDRLLGQRDVDALFGDAGDDRLYGGPGTAIIVEALIGGPGDDLLSGGAGLDTVQYFDSPRGVRVDLRSGRATGHGTDVLKGIDGATGSDFADVITGNGGGNGLFGLSGKDTIRGGGSGTILDGTSDVISGDQGADTLLGGTGQDLVTYGRQPLPVAVDLGAGAASGQGRDVISGIEGVVGSRVDDRLVGGPRADYLAGSAGNDVIDGDRGNDVVIYRDVLGPVEVALDPSLAMGDPTSSATGHGGGEFAGTDTINEVEGIWGTARADVLFGDGGANMILGFAGADHLAGFDGVDRLDGGAGTDRCDDAPEELQNCEMEQQSLGAESVAAPVWSPWLAPGRP